VKTLTVRLPEALVAEIEAESRARRVAKSDVVRERLSRRAKTSGKRRASLEAIADLVGSVAGLPADLSKRRKQHLLASGYGQKRPR
jgi:Arc/MetJ-type ribon-helix-helix transcriptional regulator